MSTYSSDRALHVNGIKQATEFQPDPFHATGVAKTAFGMERDRGGFATTDDGNDFAEAGSFRAVDESGHKLEADAPSNRIVADIDAVLAGACVGSAVAELGGIGVA